MCQRAVLGIKRREVAVPTCRMRECPVSGIKWFELAAHQARRERAVPRTRTYLCVNRCERAVAGIERCERAVPRTRTYLCVNRCERAVAGIERCERAVPRTRTYLCVNRCARAVVGIERWERAVPRTRMYLCVNRCERAVPGMRGVSERCPALGCTWSTGVSEL
ncbi:hypothetical protein NDU88_002157 [Pleurodeles waltl]|uniref:Uncharacterized protein n=1 Tax=Pleurodeles waltl TaxID=8319 RepID=A0AAV7MRY6_PLEWA|nr:hypothetical protein NDU88_002157 [Pleurodeles waltl]